MAPPVILYPRVFLGQSDPRITQSVALALKQSFQHVLEFRGKLGLHLITSDAPLTVPSANEFVERMPLAARRDLVEWERGKSPQTASRDFLSGHVPIASILPPPAFAI